MCEREKCRSRFLVVLVCYGFEVTWLLHIISLVLITTLDISLEVQTCLVCLMCDSHLFVFVWCLIHTHKYCTLSRLPAIFLVNGWNGICVSIISVWDGFRLSHSFAQNESQKVAGRAAGNAERAVMFSSKLCLNLLFFDFFARKLNHSRRSRCRYIWVH